VERLAKNWNSCEKPNESRARLMLAPKFQAAVCLLLFAFGWPGVAFAIDGDAGLIAQSQEFEPQVIEVTPGVHCAVGFGLANSILIEGPDGVIVVDTMESALAAKNVKREFDKITDKPVKAIVYTHNHYDHIMGAKIFAGDDQPEVYAHELLMTLVQRAQGPMRDAMLSRNIRQFGITAPRDSFLNAGIGPRLVLDARSPLSSFIPPTKTIGDGRTELEIAGMPVHLVHAPGETADQIYVWLPLQKTLCAADNFYKAFPNLYAIRGTPYRDPQHWVESLDQMLAEEPEHLVPSHTRPISGREQVREALTGYRDGIASVLQQTLDCMSRGMTPDQIIAEVKLPAELAENSFLQEFYGTIPWSVRAIYAGNLGWFDGNPSHLFPLSDRSRAEQMVKLVGSRQALLDKASEAHQSGDHQWAVELVDHLLALDVQDAEALELKSQCLASLAVRQRSANARNYYMTTARELSGAAGMARRDRSSSQPTANR
jgi:alkyl sulfatase BDS1-like metallo-beta-lactamase superfamily hydrolase